MGKADLSAAFKRDTVARITERGYPLAEVSQRLGVSQHSLDAWKRQLGRTSGSPAGCRVRRRRPELQAVRFPCRIVWQGITIRYSSLAKVVFVRMGSGAYHGSDDYEDRHQEWAS